MSLWRVPSRPTGNPHPNSSLSPSPEDPDPDPSPRALTLTLSLTLTLTLPRTLPRARTPGARRQRLARLLVAAITLRDEHDVVRHERIRGCPRLVCRFDALGPAAEGLLKMEADACKESWETKRSKKSF